MQVIEKALHGKHAWMAVRKFLVVAVTGATLSGCVAATIPLNMLATNAIADNMMAKAEKIPSMNCSQLKKRWGELRSPGAMMNPMRNAAAERSLVRQYAAKRGCKLPS